MTLSDPEMIQRAIARMTLSDPEMIQRAIAKITNSDVRQMLDRIPAPSMQRELKQANRALEAARKATK
jgi:hypothetical protein